MNYFVGPRNSKEKRRVFLFLLLKLESKFESKEELSRYLDVSELTIRRWTNIYNQFCLKVLLHIPLVGKRREVVTSVISKKLKKKLEATIRL